MPKNMQVTTRKHALVATMPSTPMFAGAVIGGKAGMKVTYSSQWAAIVTEQSPKKTKSLHFHPTQQPDK
jgi:hypothetical protein